MKIEIEFEAIEALKDQIKKLQSENYALNKELKALDQRKLKGDAVKLAEEMFTTAISGIFEKLGFEKDSFYNQFNFTLLEERLGKRWESSPKLTVQLGATVTAQFRTAFINLGIKPIKED